MSHSKKEYLESLRNNLKTLQLNLNDTLDKLDNLSDFDSSSGGSSPKDSDSNYQVNNILSVDRVPVCTWHFPFPGLLGHHCHWKCKQLLMSPPSYCCGIFRTITCV